MNKNLIKIIGGGILFTSTLVVSIITSVSQNQKKSEKPNNGIYSDGYFKGIYSDGYFKVVNKILESESIPIFAKHDLIKVIPHYKEECFYNAIISIIVSNNIPDKVKFDTIIDMVK